MRTAKAAYSRLAVGAGGGGAGGSGIITFILAGTRRQAEGQENFLEEQREGTGRL